MNNPLDPSLRELNDCGCGAGVEAETPQRIANRPGLTAVAYRAGTQPQFKASLLAALSSPASPAFRDLRTRDDRDFTIGLLDAWACVADVLTFYSERMANEAFLRTATERRSVLELARAIGYELKPGVAASTWLAFTVEDAKGAPGYANIPAGTKVQSLPGPDEKPQTYETVAPLVARKEWNSLRVLARALPRLAAGTRTVRFKGLTTGLRSGDGLLFVPPAGGPSPFLRTVVRVEPIAADQETRITLDRDLGPFEPAALPEVFAMRLQASQFGHNAPDWKALPDSIKASYAGSPQGDGGIRTGQTPAGSTSWQDYSGQGITLAVDTTAANLAATPTYLVSLHGTTNHWQAIGQNAIYDASATGFRIYLHGSAFNASGGPGLPITVANANAWGWYVKWVAVPGPSALGDDWPAGVLVNRRAAEGVVELDAAYPGVQPESWLVLARPGAGGPQVLVAKVQASRIASRSDLGLNSKTTVVTLDPRLAPQLSQFGLRETAVFGQSDQLEWAEAPVTTPLDRDAFSVLGQVSELPPGHLLLVRGRPSGSARDQSEVVRLREAAVAGDRTQLTFFEPLRTSYDPATVTVFANVVPATHGESVSEVLGSGDASRAHQRFTLRQPPLTYVPGGADGSASTLEVWVNDVKWREVPALYGRGPQERVYVTRQQHDGRTEVLFGDGLQGARLPTGQENVRAVYRRGAGLEGLLKADQLSLLLTRPLGVRSVTNPGAPSGAADPQAMADARRNAPRTVLTLDRIVSLSDYVDYARDFPGVAKAHGVWTWSEHTRGVLLTVLGPGGLVLPAGDATIRELTRQLRSRGNERVPVLVASKAPVRFGIRGTIRVAHDRDPDTVRVAVEDALKRQFGFEQREFGQGVALSEVIAVIQRVSGVAMVDLDALTRPGQAAGVRQPVAYLGAFAAQPGTGAGASAAAAEAAAAEVLILDESQLPGLTYEREVA